MSANNTIYLLPSGEHFMTAGPGVPAPTPPEGVTLTANNSIPDPVGFIRPMWANNAWTESSIPEYSSRDIRNAFTDSELDLVLASEEPGVKRFVTKLYTMGDYKTPADGVTFNAAVDHLDDLLLAPQALKDMKR